VGLEHFTYLLDILKKFHGVQCNMAGNKFAGMDIECNYAACRCHISMPGYICSLLLKYKHPQPANLCLSPYKCLPIAYSSKLHITPDLDALELLDANRKRRVQEIVGSLLYYAQAVANKLLVALSAIAACQAKAFNATEQAVNLLLNYVATYPSDGIVYHADTLCPRRCRLPQHNQLLQQSGCSHLPFGKQPVSTIQWCHPIYIPNNQVCHGFSRRVRASSTFHHGT
jgi:hypothetical protein